MDKLCTVCGNIGEPIIVQKGSMGVAVLLWLLWLLPGIIYSIWRANSAKEVCKSCLSPQIIPVDSPVAHERLGVEYFEKRERERQELIAENQRRISERAAYQKTEEARDAAQPFIVQWALPVMCVLVFATIVIAMFKMNKVEDTPGPTSASQVQPGPVAKKPLRRKALPRQLAKKTRLQEHEKFCETLYASCLKASDGDAPNCSAYKVQCSE